MNHPDSLYGVFLQVIRSHFHRTHELLDDIGLYPGQPPLLMILGKHDGQSQKDLANKLNIKPATITVMVNRLQKAQLVERRPDENDQRVSRVFLTEKGKEIYYEAQQLMKTVESECFQNFSVEEKILLRRFLLQMRDNLQESLNKKSQIDTDGDDQI